MKYLIGSHNSCSYATPKKWYMKLFHFAARCQELDIKTQYEKYNVRVFDIRIKVDKYYNVEICHGLISFDIDIKDVLRYLNSKKDCYCRIILEDNLNTPNGKDKRTRFIKICRIIEQDYPNIKFFGGIAKYPWGEKLYDFNNNIELDDNYSSVKAPKLIDDLYPRWYASKNNKYIYAAGTNKQCLFIDFVNIK